MKCPHCREEIPGLTCPQCNTVTPEGGRYCMACGAPLISAKDASLSAENEDTFDLENRILCPDGTCTGIIVDGRCTECGKVYHDKK